MHATGRFVRAEQNRDSFCVTIWLEIYNKPLRLLLLIRTVICLNETFERPHQQLPEVNSFLTFFGDVLAVDDGVLLKGVDDNSYSCLRDSNSGDFLLRGYS